MHACMKGSGVLTCLSNLTVLVEVDDFLVVSSTRHQRPSLHRHCHALSTCEAQIPRSAQRTVLQAAGGKVLEQNALAGRACVSRREPAMKLELAHERDMVTSGNELDDRMEDL